MSYSLGHSARQNVCTDVCDEGFSEWMNTWAMRWRFQDDRSKGFGVMWQLISL